MDTKPDQEDAHDCGVDKLHSEVAHMMADSGCCLTCMLEALATTIAEMTIGSLGHRPNMLFAIMRTFFAKIVDTQALMLTDQDYMEQLAELRAHVNVKKKTLISVYKRSAKRPTVRGSGNA